VQTKIEKKFDLIRCADKNHQIWRFLDQSSDMTFTGPPKGLQAEDPEKTTPFVLSHQSPKGVESRV